MTSQHVKRVCVTIYPEELAILKKKSRESGLPLSRYLVLRSLDKLKVK